MFLGSTGLSFLFFHVVEHTIKDADENRKMAWTLLILWKRLQFKEITKKENISFFFSL